LTVYQIDTALNCGYVIEERRMLSRDAVPAGAGKGDKAMKKLVVGLAGIVLASQSFGGISMTSVTTIDSGGGSSREPVTMKMQVDGERARIEWAGGRGPSGGGYMLTTDGGQTVFMVNPEEKTYMKWDIEKMLQGVGGMMDQMKGLMQVKVTDHNVEKVADEAGPAILGYPTRHYKFVTRMTTETTIFGRKQTNTSTNEQEVWATTKMEAPGFAIWRKMQSQKTGFADMDKLIEAERAKGIKGIPLKTILTAAGARGRTTKTVTEVTQVTEGRIDGSAFEIPKDYKEETLEIPAEAAGKGETESGETPPDQSKSAPSPVDAFLKSFKSKSK